MPIIISSQIMEDSPQRDGRRYIRERHTEADGRRHEYVWLAEAAQNTAPVLVARAAWLETQLPAVELTLSMDRVLVGDQPVIRYATAEAHGLALRERYRTATGMEIAYIARWLLTRTDEELRAWFGGLTQTQVNQLKTRAAAKVAALDSLNALAGE